jgi:hypothetical protein
MQKPTSLADHLQDWETLLAAVDQNLGDLPQLQITRNKLSGMLEHVRELLPLQAEQASVKQSTTEQLQAAFNAGRKLATVIRFTVKEHYGNRSQKLTEFRIQPFRSRTVPPTLPAPESPAPETEPAPASPEE